MYISYLVAHDILRDFVPLVNIFGVYIQIRDDYMNLQSTEVSMHSVLFLPEEKAQHTLQHSDNKGFAEDLTEGKFSFPIVHGVRADEQNRVIMSA